MALVAAYREVRYDRRYHERSQDEVWGNAFRKPRQYAPLTSPEVALPFVRESARR
jgi:hypothetical protein